MSSILCASVSPMPMRAPEQSSMPWVRTKRQVSWRSSQLWVVTTWGKKDREVSRLWLYRWTPPSASRRAWSSVSRPALTATLRPVARRMTGTSSRMRVRVRSSGPRTARTRQNSDAPAALVSSAARSTSSVSRNGVAFTGLSKREDWEQKWQSSGQPPVLADRIPSTSTSGPHHSRRTWWARAASEVTRSSGSSASPASSPASSRRRRSKRASSAEARRARAVAGSTAGRAGSPRRVRLGGERATVVRMGVGARSRDMPLR